MGVCSRSEFGGKVWMDKEKMNSCDIVKIDTEQNNI